MTATAAGRSDVRNGKRICSGCLAQPIPRHSLCSSARQCGCECRDNEKARTRLIAREAEARQAARERAGTIDHLLGDDDDHDDEEEIVHVDPPAASNNGGRSSTRDVAVRERSSTPPPRRTPRPRPVPVSDVPSETPIGDGIVWCDPPPWHTGRRPTDWRPVLAPLVAKPGKWALIRTFNTKSGAYTAGARLRKGEHPMPPGRWQFRGGHLDDGSGGLWARYLGPEKDTA